MRLLNLAILLVILLMCAAHLAHGAETIYYTTNGNEVDLPIPEWINQKNPPCGENDRLYTGRYDDIRFDKQVCYRWRPWVCVPTNAKGVGVEILPKHICDRL